ncbi:hypothetical protein CTA2_3498 [Colletotrichum tanaceti]|nr:hypothetical protein CTA2_3498 [Colletotrichum tanaceti]
MLDDIMSVPSFIRPLVGSEIRTVEMHTSGEPARIVYVGYPDIAARWPALDSNTSAAASSTSRAGRRDMYAAVLRPRTKLVDEGEGRKWALCSSRTRGYGAMYGHAAVALGRFSVAPGTGGAETGLYFFGDQQIDRSPTVWLRRAGEGGPGPWPRARGSLVSRAVGGYRSASVGTPVEEVEVEVEVEVGGSKAWRVEVSGNRTFYIGSSTFVAGEEDDVGRGFSFQSLGGGNEAVRGRCSVTVTRKEDQKKMRFRYKIYY